jgi:hypothetical protein
MASNLTTKYDFQMMHHVTDVVTVTKAAQNDYFSFAKYPGVFVIAANVLTSIADTVTNVFESPQYGTMKANGAVAATTTTSVVFDNASATRIVPYYVLNATTGEIMYVTADSGTTTTSGTLTVRRGVLGTTATAIADNAPLYVLNQIVLSTSTVGQVLLQVMPLPMDPGTPLFKAEYYS